MGDPFFVIEAERAGSLCETAFLDTDDTNLGEAPTLSCV